MSVLDALPENKPIALLKEVDQVAREIKSSQTRGSVSVLNYRIFSQSEYDILLPGDYSQKVLEIEFLPTNMQFGGGLCYRVYVAVLQGTAAPYSDSVNLRRMRVVEQRQRWRYQNSFGVATRLKFYFFAQCSGTFTVKII